MCSSTAKQSRELAYWAALDSYNLQLANHIEIGCELEKSRNAVSTAIHRKNKENANWKSTRRKVAKIHETLHPLRLKKDNLLDQLKSRPPNSQRIEVKLDKVRSELESIKGEVAKANSDCSQAEKVYYDLCDKLDVACDQLRKIELEHNHSRQSLLQYKQKLWEASAARVMEEERTLVMNLAWIPSRYRWNAKVLKNEKGRYDIYYGGEGRPDGDGHGHAVIEPDNTPTYHRRPGQDHRSTTLPDLSDVRDFVDSDISRGRYSTSRREAFQWRNNETN